LRRSTLIANFGENHLVGIRQNEWFVFFIFSGFPWESFIDFSKHSPSECGSLPSDDRGSRGSSVSTYLADIRLYSFDIIAIAFRRGSVTSMQLRTHALQSGWGTSIRWGLAAKCYSHHAGAFSV
jgi:hypothetical protein